MAALGGFDTAPQGDLNYLSGFASMAGGGSGGGGAAGEGISCNPEAMADLVAGMAGLPFEASRQMANSGLMLRANSDSLMLHQAQQVRRTTPYRYLYLARHFGKK